MIKVELYEGSFEWENEEPNMILSLKEFERCYNSGKYAIRDYYKIRFIVV